MLIYSQREAVGTGVWKKKTNSALIFTQQNICFILVEWHPLRQSCELVRQKLNLLWTVNYSCRYSPSDRGLCFFLLSPLINVISLHWMKCAHKLPACISLPQSKHKNKCVKKLQPLDSMGLWSWNNRGHNTAPCPGWNKPAPSLPAPSLPSSRRTHSFIRWRNLDHILKPIPGLKPACQRQIGPYQEHRGAVAPQHHQDPYHTPLIQPSTHLSIYALHKFYWLRQVSGYDWD